MGDIIGESLGGRIFFIPKEEFLRLNSCGLENQEKIKILAYMCRVNTLYMIARAGSGHIGSSFSSMEIMCSIELNELCNEIGEINNSSNNVFF